MLALTATAVAREALRALRPANPTLFGIVADWLEALRTGDGAAVGRGRTFRLDDDRTARLVTFYDADAQRDLVIVWLLDEGPDGPAVKVIAVEHVH